MKLLLSEIIFLRKSPTSMKVVHRQLREEPNMSFADCFMLEYRLARRSMMNKDFYEGVRAGNQLVTQWVHSNTMGTQWEVCHVFVSD